MEPKDMVQLKLLRMMEYDADNNGWYFYSPDCFAAELRMKRWQVEQLMREMRLRGLLGLEKSSNDLFRLTGKGYSYRLTLEKREAQR